MVHRRLLLAALVAFLGISFTAAQLAAQRPAKAPKPVYEESAENFGYRRPPVDLRGLAPARETTGMLVPPPAWDWRAMGGVTSVKNQNPYGTCWAFAGLGDLESKIQINESTTFDFSEVNIVACTPVTGTDCNTGGNAWMTTNYLSLLGTVAESCNPYPGGCPAPACVNPACSYLRRVTEWRVIPNDVTAIKEAVMMHGPVYVAMYASFPGFSTYNGTTCLTYTGPGDPNHAVLIVGWDDSMCDGAGAWIVKNSWGTGWGAAGYFYIRYGSAQIGTDASVYTGNKLYNPNEKIYHFDEWGWWGSVGYGDQDDYGMVAITPTGAPAEGELLRAVDFWAVWAPTNYTIEIYDTFNGGSLSNLIAGPFTGTKTEAGFYSFTLPAPITVHNGDPIYIKMRCNTPGYNFPVPIDDSGPMETNKCYVSNGGTTWSALDLGNYAMGDVGIRARIEPIPVGTSCSWEGDPVLRYGWNYLDGYPYNQPGWDVATIYAGATIEREVLCVNAWTSYKPAGVCAQIDTVCASAFSYQGWTVAGSPPLGTLFIAGQSQGWYQYVDITAPCSVVPGDKDTVVVIMSYANTAGVCDYSCGDCYDPNLRPTDGLYYYSADTLVITVIATPPALGLFQDTLTLVERGQTQAYVPFTICNQDDCAPLTTFNYSISTTGHVPYAVPPGTSVDVLGGTCEDIYAILNAGTATACTYDTLTIIVWVGSPAVYDTCVQVIHVVEPEPVPLFTVPVVTILVLALILAAAVFMRRRAAARA